MIDKGEKVRIKVKYAQYIRTIAEQREETFLDALYYVIDFHRQAVKGNQPIPLSPVSQSIPTVQPQTISEIDSEDVDISDFE